MLYIVKLANTDASGFGPQCVVCFGCVIGSLKVLCVPLMSVRVIDMLYA